MDALDLLLSRSSQPKLQEPAPTGDALENIKQAALRAPDHASLKPWEFVVCTGEGLHSLGNILQESAIAEGKGQESIERALQLPHRAPMVIVAMTRYTEHPKVPSFEQTQSTACAIHAMQMAALAQGFQGIWRTGTYAQSDFVKAAFDLGEKDEIVGFLYLGTSSLKPMPKPKVDSAQFFKTWS